MQEIKTLFPELTGEQLGYIVTMGSQSLLAGGGGMPFQTIAVLEKGIVFQEIKGSENNVTTYVSVKDGKVQIISSKVFYLQNAENIVDLDDKSEANKLEIEKLPILKTSLVVDITALKKSEFKLGDEAIFPTHIVAESMRGNNSELLDAFSKSYKAGVVKDTKLMQTDIELARNAGGEFQRTSQQENHPNRVASKEEIEKRQILYERFLGSQKGERSKADIEANFLQLLHHSKEFMADRMADEYLGNTELWKSWKGYASAIAEFPQVSNKEAAATQIYSVLEEDPNKRSKYAAAKLVQYLDGQTYPNDIETDPDIKAIAGPLVKKAQGLFGKDFLQQVQNLHNIKDDPKGYKCSLESLVYLTIEKDPTKQLNYASNKLLEYVSASPNPSKEAVTSIVSPMLPGDTKILDRDADLILRSAKESKGLPLKDRFMKIVDKVRISVGMVSHDVAKVATQVKNARKRSFVEMEKRDGPASKKTR